jgi:fumarate hydratase subunit beta
MRNEKDDTKKGETKTIQINVPISEEVIRGLKIGDFVEINGTILCGRDAVLPKMVKMVEEGNNETLLDLLRGAVIFHTAVSIAGIGPTSSNKVEIEGSIPGLSKAGVKIHLGKGALSAESLAALQTYNSVFAITPPVTAYFSSKIISQKVAMFPEEGMEALYEVKVEGFPAIIAMAHGESIFTNT